MTKLISISKDANPNYLAKIIRVPKLRKHANADRLMVMTVDGNDIITSSETQEGTVSIYFPLECQLSHDYLSKNNDYRKTLNLNVDLEAAGGFFEEKRRIRAVKLRGEKSQGYVVPISTMDVLVGNKYKELENYIGEEFDTIDGQLLLNKYVVREVTQQQSNGKKAVKLESKLVDNQFRLHYDTAQFGKNLYRLKPEDLISITWKLHGTSFVSSKILCKRKLNWRERVVRWLGFDLTQTEYANIYSSRKVIKNEDLNTTPQHYYKYDLWGDINDTFKDQLHDGETIYGECVGFTKTGEFIQGGFDYGCAPKEKKLYVYRITHTNTSGKVIDLPFNMVQQRCEQLGVEAVPLIFFGKAKEFHPTVYTITSDGIAKVKTPASMVPVEVWRESFFDTLKEKYVFDQDSQFCKNKVPEEGVVVRIEGLNAEAFKLKAFRFLENESKELDKGEANIEDQVAAE